VIDSCSLIAAPLAVAPLTLLDRIILPLLNSLDAETAHDLAIRALELGLVPSARRFEETILRTRVWGLGFPSPVGLAAGFDKNARAAAALLRLGFGFVEVGTVTPKPQPGNPKPRLFRLREDKAIINRFGFNNDGLDAFAKRLETFANKKPGIIGANVGMNKNAADPAADYAQGIERLAPLADYLVINVSSPNTQGLRDLQGKEQLLALLTEAQAARARSYRPQTPLLIKIAPDLEAADIDEIAHIALNKNVDGVIATNTTIARPANLSGKHAAETGGLSGAPLLDRSTDVLRRLYQVTEGKLPLIGVGGVFTAADAYRKIRNGASLVQVYTGFIYGGMDTAMRINTGLAELLAADGFGSVAEAVGADA